MINRPLRHNSVVLIGFTRFTVVSDTYVFGAFVNKDGVMWPYEIRIHDIFAATTMQDVIDGLEPPRPEDRIVVHNLVDLPHEEDDVSKIHQFVLKYCVHEECRNIYNYPLILLPQIARFVQKHNITFQNNAESLKKLYKTLTTSALGSGLLSDDFLYMMDQPSIAQSKAYSSYQH